MLLTNVVKIKWNRRMVTYYKNKNYQFTKIGDEFEVEVEDLTDMSSVHVTAMCDNCNKIIEGIRWNNYKRCLKENNKYYCMSCAIKLYGSANATKTKLKNGKSFEQWCMENEKHDLLGRWDYDLNDCKPNEVGFGSNKRYYFKCPRGIHTSELKIINSLTYGKCNYIDCNQCSSFAQWGIDNLGEDFLEKYWDYDKNDKLRINPWKITFGSNKNAWFKCQQRDYHESYKTKCVIFTNGSRCPYCSNHHGKVHRLDSLGKLLEDKNLLCIWSDKNKKSPFEYSPKSNKNVWWKCFDDEHEDYCRKISESNDADFRCSECVRERKESFLQEKVRLYLNELGYILLHEHNCNIVPHNPKKLGKNNTLPYDNEVVDLKLIIEVHGKQHYNEMAGKWRNRYFNLHYQQLKDRYKRIYAKSKGYEFLEIPYWTDNKEEKWKMLIDKKVEKILHNINNINTY